MSFKIGSVAAVAALCCLAGSASASIVFQANSDNGFFTPFNGGNAATVKYADSGWIGFDAVNTYTLTKITLGLAAFGSTGAGTTDIKFTFNDGDPSGLIFGTAALLYSTTITNVAIPDSSTGVRYFDLEIPLPNIVTLGGFNNVGWSIGLQNYNYSGQFGFQCGVSQPVGFYTNNATYYDGSSWSQFNFGNSNANFTAAIDGFVTPAPSAAGLAGLAGVVAFRRRR